MYVEADYDLQRHSDSFYGNTMFSIGVKDQTMLNFLSLMNAYEIKIVYDIRSNKANFDGFSQAELISLMFNNMGTCEYVELPELSPLVWIQDSLPISQCSLGDLVGACFLCDEAVYESGFHGQRIFDYLGKVNPHLQVVHL